MADTDELRLASESGEADAIKEVMDHAQSLTASLPVEDLGTALATLQGQNAFDE